MVYIHPALINFKRPSPHSIFSPSSIDRWLKCPFSIRASHGIVIPPSKYAEEGTLAHTYCEHLFRWYYYSIPFPVHFQIELHRAVEKGVINLPELERAAHIYVNTIGFWLNNTEAVGQVLWFGLEKGIPIFPEESCFGTGDCVIVGTKGAVVVDFKYGQGKLVSGNSLQLKAYATGIFRYLQNLPENYLFHAVVVQPRTDELPKEATYTPQDLHEFAGVIWQAIQKSKESGLTPVTGECHWCPARQVQDVSKKCPEIVAKPMRLAEQNFRQFLADTQIVPSQNGLADTTKRDLAIVKLMNLKPIIDKIVEEGKIEFTERLKKGEYIEGVKLETKIGSRQWKDDKETTIKNLSMYFPTLEATKTQTVVSLKSLGDLEKIVGKNKLDFLTIKKSSKELALDDGKAKSIMQEMAQFIEVPQ